MITKVTITGADDSVMPKDLLDLSKQYPFVEWGILLGNAEGINRFPSQDWMETFYIMNMQLGIESSAHLCGEYSRRILFDHPDTRLTQIIDNFNRIQINTHSKKHDFFYSALEKMAKMPRQFIFQSDGHNTWLIESAIAKGVNAAVLFDRSGGAGQVPERWHAPLKHSYCGYAGGLGPHNLEAEIKRILGVSGTGTPIWIDMETHVRSDNDRRFDLDKVEACLRIAKPYVTPV